MFGKALIFGGSGGIGSAIARRLKAAGYDLHITGRQTEKVQSIAEELGAGYTAGDVLDADFFSKVAQQAGDTLAAVVYSVGSINLRGLARLTEQDLLNDYRINACGAALAIQAALPALKNHGAGASVVLFSSVAALQGFPLHASIGMAKSAIIGLTLTLASELAPRIRVNAIAPSLTETPLASSILSNEAMASTIAGLHPLQRIGQATDIAAMAAFLISSEADWITGQVLSVDGGRSTLRPRG